MNEVIIWSLLSGAAKRTNCAPYDKSTKFGTDVH